MNEESWGKGNASYRQFNPPKNEWSNPSRLHPFIVSQVQTRSRTGTRIKGERIGSL